MGESILEYNGALAAPGKSLFWLSSRNIKKFSFGGKRLIHTPLLLFYYVFFFVYFPTLTNMTLIHLINIHCIYQVIVSYKYITTQPSINIYTLLSI